MQTTAHIGAEQAVHGSLLQCLQDGRSQAIGAIGLLQEMQTGRATTAVEGRQHRNVRLRHRAKHGKHGLLIAQHIALRAGQPDRNALRTRGEVQRFRRILQHGP